MTKMQTKEGVMVKENLKYMLKNWFEWDKKSVIYFVVRIPALVFQPIVTAYIPKAMIDCIENGVTIQRLIEVIALLSLLLTLTIWLDPFMKELIKGSARVIRMRYAVMAFDKNMNTDFMDIEGLDAREKNNRASEFYKSYYSASADIFDTLNNACVCVVGIIASLALIYKINFLIIFVILISCVAEFFALKFLNKRKLKGKDEIYGIYTKFNYFYSQSKNSDASKDITLYGFGDSFIKTMAQLILQFETIVSRFSKQNVSVSATRAFLNMIRELIAYAYLVYLVTTGMLTVSDFIFCFGIITGFSNWIMNFVFCYSDIESHCNDCARFREFVEKEQSAESDLPDFEDEEINSIEFKNVSFTYPQAESSTVKNMSFKINKGENIAIVGENGAGKTTVVKLLCGLYYATSGDILINGKKANSFSRKSYFALFSPVFQDYCFLPVTIAENIAAAKKYDEEKLRYALETAGIADKINLLEKKENTYMIKEVHKDAVDFSGGEKQKLLLAKALYKAAPVLILDEPTAALDPISENELYLKYNELTNNKISFFISHRLSSTRFCDRIMFISDGQISEYGTHEELMKKKGKYYHMYQLQSYYYKEQGARL